MTGQLTASDMTSEAVLSVPDFFAAAAEVMAARGWIQGTLNGPNGEVCEEGAVLRVVCTPGDQHLALAVLVLRRGGGHIHNDRPGNTAEGSLNFLRSLGPITERDMAAIFGPNWRAVRTLVRQAASATAKQLIAAQPPKPCDAAARAEWRANREAAWGAAREAEPRETHAWCAWRVARASLGTAWSAELGGVEALSDASLAVVVADLAGQHGLKQDDLDALRAPWADVFGDPLEVTA